jgi:hypothetical protein
VESEYNASLDDIRRHLDRGAYVIVNYLNAFSGNGHYAAIVNYDEMAFYLADSSLGALRLSNEHLLNHWHSGDRATLRWYLSVK